METAREAGKEGKGGTEEDTAVEVVENVHVEEWSSFSSGRFIFCSTCPMRCSS